jgi:hypothetical protein
MEGRLPKVGIQFTAVPQEGGSRPDARSGPTGANAAAEYLWRDSARRARPCVEPRLRTGIAMPWDASWTDRPKAQIPNTIIMNN